MLAASSRRGRMFMDAGWIALSSLAAAALGLAFWGVAGHLLSPAKLGVQTALLAAITAPGAIAATGVGDALNSVAGANPEHRRRLIRHAYQLTVLTGLPLSAAAGVLAAIALPGHRGSLAVGASVTVGGLVWALFIVQDSALTSLRKTAWLPVENVLAGVAKIGLLLGIHAVAFGVVWSSVVPAGMAVVILLPIIDRMSRNARKSRHAVRSWIPRVDELSGTGLDYRDAHRAFNRLAVRTLCAVALTLGALTFLPFVVTVVGGPTQGALFALAWGMASVLDYASHGVATALLVHTAESQGREPELTGHALRPTLTLVIVGALAVVGLCGPVFTALNATYVALHGIAVVGILCLASVLRVVYFIWVSGQQARQEMTPVLRLNGVGAIVMYSLVICFAGHDGALVGATAMAASQAVLSAVALVLMRARRRRSLDIHRSGFLPSQHSATAQQHR
jgi:O-antigen/teichoic acid export membrane protein